MYINASALQHNRGFTLIDALISVVVFALGVAAIAAFNTRLVSDSGLSKTRAQAVALAQDKMEDLRTNLINNAAQGASADNNFSKLATGSDTHTSGNASFTRAWTVSKQWTVANQDAIPVAKNIDISVTWTDPKDGAQTVALSSQVSWDSPMSQVDAADHAAFNKLGSIPPPTGGGDLHLGDLPLDRDGNPVVVENNTDFGITVEEYGDGALVYFETVDSSNNTIYVWMTLPTGAIKLIGTIRLSTTAVPNHFTTDQTDGRKTYIVGGLRAIAADAGVCREKLSGDGDHLDFVCYVGKDWYGRVGVMAIDQIRNSLEMILVHVQEADPSHPDQLCPLSYRYGSSCEVTGAFTLDGVNYCSSQSTKADFTPASTVIAHSTTGDPLLYGTLGNQNFIIMNDESSCP